MEPAGEGEHCFIQLEKCGEPIGMRISCGGDALTEAELLEVLKQASGLESTDPGPTEALPSSRYRHLHLYICSPSSLHCGGYLH